MKIIFTLAVTVLMSVGVFANSNSKNINPELKNNISNTLIIENKTVKPVLESNAAAQIDAIVICSDGSSYYVSCDGCTIGTVVDVAIALCS